MYQEMIFLKGLERFQDSSGTSLWSVLINGFLEVQQEIKGVGGGMQKTLVCMDLKLRREMVIRNIDFWGIV